jgi:SAM-dependent methyltransferase
MKLQDPQLRQRGRASVDFLAQLGLAAGHVIERVAHDMAAHGLTAAALPDDLDDRDAFVDAALSGSNSYAVQKLVGDWHGRMHGPIAIEAFEEIEAELQPVLDASTQGEATLTLDPMLSPPQYWDGVHFHRTAGGWEGHRHMGYVHSEIIHKKLVARFFPDGIFKQRRDVAAMAPRSDYTRILDMGCSSGHFTSALAEVFPNAQITGVDLSARMLEHAHRTANAHGWNWQLYQRPAEATGFPDASFDLVASYILLHEVPETANRAIFAEAFRVLEPGGDLLMSDVTRFADLDKLSAWKADRGARFGGEPYWRESASLDLAVIARDAGFEAVEATGIYPHVVKARKPA